MSKERSCVDRDIERLKRSFEHALEGSDDLDSLKEVERDFLGKKGALRTLRTGLGGLDIQSRRIVGALVESTITEAERALLAKRTDLEAVRWIRQMDAEWIDVTVAPAGTVSGAQHAISRLEQRCIEILQSMGFQVEDGPEVENAYYNFDALNVSKDHPARDLQDTFWLENGLLMRSHTTSIQARVLEQNRPLPVRVIARGRVYRNEAVDATHLAMFHQLEGFWLAERVSLAHLKYVLGVLVRNVFGERPYRFKPKYYPYTEPSLGLDIGCSVCSGAGCASCHYAGWVTVIGAGMIHPSVLREFGYDPDRCSGFAFGWGTTRLAYQWLGLEKVKDLYSTNVEDLKYYSAVATGARVVR
jgi:phenylalanyl-tRNA synthetase alpha chain